MKKTLLISKVLPVYSVLSQAKYGQMNDADKIKAWKIARAMKPIADQYDDTAKDAAEKFKPTVEDFEQKLEKSQMVQQMLRMPNADIKTMPMGIAEYNQFMTEVMNPYNRLVAKALDEVSKKEVTLEYDGLSEAAFEKLMSSNDWTFEQAVKLSELMVE